MKKGVFCTLLLSVFLTAAFFVFPPLPVSAEEIPENTASQEVPPTEYQAPAEEPSETINAAESTESAGNTESTETTESVEAVPGTAEPEDDTMPPDAAPMLLTLLPEEYPPAAAIIAISRIPELHSGTEGISFQGTVVLVKDQDVVVQDDTGGIRVSLTQSHDFATGDILLITGRMEESFCVDTAVKQGTGALPVVETPLSHAPEALRIAVKGASIENGILTQDSTSFPLYPADTADGPADVSGVIADGIFYADTVIPLEQPSRPLWDWNVYFGLLHAHTELSDGSGSVSEAFSQAAGVDGLNFFAVTDHSNSFDNAGSGSITAEGSALSARWAEGKRAAASVTGGNFVGIFGYEMTWGEDKTLGHISTFHTPGWQTRDQAGFGTLEGYYHALTQVPDAVSQFNHPGIAYGEFHGFRDYDPAYDAVMQLLEIEGEKGESYYSYYIRALDAGWHVAPTVGQNNHHGNWGSEGLSRTAVLARELTETALYQAMQRRRVYATQDPDLRIDYRLNGHIMGSIIGTSDTMEIQVRLEDPTDTAGCTVEVISTGGRSILSKTMDIASGEMTFRVPGGYPYYFLKITQPDGDVAVTAPVWSDDFTDMGIQSLRADTDNLRPGTAVNLTLELYNREVVPFQVSSASLLRGEETVGTFSSAGDGTYTASFLWTQPGEVRLTAVVQGTVDGKVRSYRQNLTLHYPAANVCSASIAQARNGQSGTVFAIEGYATSGNTNPYTTFPDTIYVQDSTGGIAVVGAFPQAIQIGTPLKITGVLRECDAEPYLDLIQYELQQKTMYRYVPAVLSCKAVSEYQRLGGRLVQVTGTVLSLTTTADGRGISRLTLQDHRGDTAVVVIDREIRSGAYGTNRLASQIRVGRAVRAVGIVHREASGEVVLRVRNCDEVVYVPPIPDPTNYQTGDSGFVRSSVVSGVTRFS